MHRWIFSTSWKARRNFRIQRAKAARSFSSRDRNLSARTFGCVCGGRSGRMMRRRDVDISTPLDNLKLDAAILEHLLVELIALFACLQLGFFNGVRLEKSVHFRLISP